MRELEELGLSLCPQLSLPAGPAVPVFQHGSHYPLAQAGPGTAVGSWQCPHAPAGTNELTGIFLSLLNTMESHFLGPFPTAAPPASWNVLWWDGNNPTKTVALDVPVIKGRICKCIWPLSWLPQEPWGRQSPWPSLGQDLHSWCSSTPHTSWCWHRSSQPCAGPCATATSPAQAGDSDPTAHHPMALAAPWQHNLSTAASRQRGCTPSLVIGSPGRKHPHRRDVPSSPLVRSCHAAAESSSWMGMGMGMPNVPMTLPLQVHKPPAHLPPGQGKGGPSQLLILG